ncbi:MAG: phosphoribosylanthranilate isomerase [Syntrophobacteraceae bacterium]
MTEANRISGCGKACQVKVCGLTRVDEAVGCAELGADAIGLVFFPRSPRFVTDELASAIVLALPPHVAKVGVFVDESFETVVRKVRDCGLTAVQLHGKESPQMAARLMKEGVRVFKALFANASPGLDDADRYAVTAYLVECAGGVLPGGNAMSWDWGMARELARTHPIILAGGLTPANVVDAIRRACPDAVDISSGVEARPGRKDLEKVKDFLRAVRDLGEAEDGRSVFS